MIDLNQLASVPGWITIPVIVTLMICLLVGIPLARKAGARWASLHRAQDGAHQGAHDGAPRNRMRLALFAALAPTVVVWLAVVGMSFIGLTGFANDTMRWHHWTNLLVPLSLDGISISFGGWAFVAVKRGRNPGRAYRIVLGAATVSATLNFVHGKDQWSLWAGGYLAFLSVAGMAMFHEMLDQFMADIDGDIALKVRYPRFGQRWIYAPFTTFAARRVWIVYPPTEGTRPTVQNALEHWCTIKHLTPEQRILRTANATAVPAQALPHAGRPRRANGVSVPLPSSVAAGAALDRGRIAGDLPLPSGTANDSNTLPPGPSGDPAATATVDPSQPETHTPTATVEDEATNAAINRAAEDLWLEYKATGVDLTGSQLLREFHRRHPHRRKPRWADYRRKAALARHHGEEPEPAIALGADTE
jgi:hypothetical protein